MDIRTMNRGSWTFPYAADKLHTAATVKAEHHTERLRWWTKSRDDLMAEIREKGLDFDMSMADASMSNSYRRQPMVQVRDDLARDLAECNQKILEHQGKLDGYQSWVEVLASQARRYFDLNMADWMYFFGGKTDQAAEELV